MTAKRDFKRRVRERQVRTGESYVTARRRVAAAATARAAMSVIEAVDVTDTAARLGFRCRVAMFAELVEQLAPPVVLASLRDVLVAAPGGLATARMFDVAFGLPLVPAPLELVSVDGLRQFYQRLRAGLSVTAVNGTMLGWHVMGPAGIVPVVCSVWAQGRPVTHGVALAPSLVLTVAHGTLELPMLVFPASRVRSAATDAVRPAVVPHLISRDGPDPGFAPGQRVRVIAGPFEGADAIVEAVGVGTLRVAIAPGGTTASAVLGFDEVVAIAPALFVIVDGQRHPITRDRFVIGRDRRAADLAIRDGLVSRAHAAVIRRDGAYYLKDLGATHGIRYEGMAIDHKRIDEGDVFELGGHELRFTFVADG